ncbi:uncharacterized protein STEHIDRAFT_115115 [Stereum hirsutum FP-91666 SS1]|uniref:uncharacterized protein n=1 Tax=Stereum hirsutum (strain FP-91666) TaxID=721885 RepID=UPI0004449DB7|nr:uncharacterized protein STEHIDRAFT_115115 [Stereum hirsutum FP-91666 SS1]EIM81750.1 hypothetical protein STEHIDRAFT_115115 [Stereum hirsutum FP-91666 SS1]
MQDGNGCGKSTFANKQRTSTFNTIPINRHHQFNSSITMTAQAPADPSAMVMPPAPERIEWYCTSGLKPVIDTTGTKKGKGRGGQQCYKEDNKSSSECDAATEKAGSVPVNESITILDDDTEDEADNHQALAIPASSIVEYAEDLGLRAGCDDGNGIDEVGEDRADIDFEEYDA